MLILQNSMQKCQYHSNWTSPNNKIKLQQLASQLASTADLNNLKIVISGYVKDEEIMPAHLLLAGRFSPQLSEYIDALTCHVEEADDHLVLHCVWEVDNSSSKLLVISYDTDTIVCLLCFIPQLQQRGLQGLLVEFGSGEHKHHLPLHVLADNLGERMCRIILKAYVLMGDDSLSKIGTMHASLENAC